MIDDDRHIPVKLYFDDPRPRYAEGGLVHAAEAVRQSGRFGDEMVIHVNRREFDELRQKWGDPHINPDTGLPEFFDLKDLWKGVKKVAGPIAGVAAGALLPGIGSAVGAALPGVASVLGSTGTQALASGLIGAGVGALTNGGTGALLGGLGGVGGAYGGDLLKNGSSSALASALSGGTGLLSSAGSAATGGGGMGSSALTPALLMAALNLGGSALEGGGKGDKVAKGEFKDAQNEFNEPLPTYENKRKRVYYGVPDYTTQGEQSYFENNGFADGGKVEDRLPDAESPYYRDPPYNPDEARAKLGIDPMSWLGRLLGAQLEYPEVADGKGDKEQFRLGCGYAEGGYIENSTGDHGRSDKIEALLSPNEYVIDAETVALLGNGSPEAGAEQLDRLRENIRKHKGSALAAGAISPDAMPAEAYME